MKLCPSLKPETCVSKDKYRPCLSAPYLAKQADGEIVIVATDGRMMVKLPVLEAIDDEVGYIPIPALKDGRKLGQKSGVNEIALNGDAKLPNGQAFPRPTVDQLGNYPKFEQVWPAKDTVVTMTISFNPALLAKIAEAMGDCEIVTLSISDPLSPLIVTPGKGGQGVGLLMPARAS